MTARAKSRRAGAPAPVDLDDPEAVLRLVDDAREVPCTRCNGSGKDPVPFGSYTRACTACEGTTLAGLEARRTIERHAVQVARTLARVVHRQRPALPLAGGTTDVR